MRSILAVLLVAMSLTSCVSNFRDTTAYYHTGKPKPSVALLPVINSSGEQSLAWDLSYELTEGMKKRLVDSHKLYLMRDEQGSIALAESLNQQLPSGISKSDLSELGNAEFVIVTELIEQKITPYGPAAAEPSRSYVVEAGAVLTLSMRVSVIDIRSDEPTIALQEIVDTDHNITKPYLYIDYTKHPYGTPFYEKTPLGIAHAKLIREVVSHIEGYVRAR